MHYRPSYLVKVPRIKVPHLVLRVDDEKEELHHDRVSTRTHEHVPAMADVRQRMENYPTTWKPYLGTRDGMMNIVEMEYGELMLAKAEGSKHKQIKELTDLAAACMFAIEKLSEM